MKNLKPIVLHAIELILFCFGLAIAIPPTVSQTGQVYSLIPVLVIGGGSFAGSLLLAYRRHAENLPSASIKLLFYFVFAWIVHARVFG